MQGRCFAVKKRKKKIALAVAAVLVVLAGAAAVYFACMPDLTVYYNASDGAAWQVQTKTGVRQKIELPGYENVSLVTPFDGGWYACAEKGGQSYFVLVQGGQVCGELSVQTLGSGGHVDEMYAADGGLYASCFTGENVKMLFADFENAQVSELPAEQTNYPTYLCAAGRTVLLGGIGRDNVPRLYRYQGGQLQALVAGGEPVLLNETQFLYTDDESGDLMLYGSSTVVLFYENFSSPYRYTVLGHVENPDGLQVALGRGNPTVTFAAVPEEEKKRLASDGAVIQRENPSMPTRVLKSGTRIRMHFGDTVIPGILNDGETARALIARLPVTVRMSRYSHDFCGVLAEPLPCRESEVHYGWLNGDIDFARDGSYFTILFADEENSEQYGHQINIGVITCELSRLAGLRGSYEVRIELAE